ncbi:uncharacterized protein V1518DRAFT_421511 [Limtongia smithiae]|uniref:uncharacterized protein n=1 Tax=Limtongia smithiae TaxID=1125753 RepID=UPI0034CFFA11
MVPTSSRYDYIHISNARDTNQSQQKYCSRYLLWRIFTTGVCVITERCREEVGATIAGRLALTIPTIANSSTGNTCNGSRCQTSQAFPRTEFIDPSSGRKFTGYFKSCAFYTSGCSVRSSNVSKRLCDSHVKPLAPPTSTRLAAPQGMLRIAIRSGDSPISEACLSHTAACQCRCICLETRLRYSCARVKRESRGMHCVTAKDVVQTCELETSRLVQSCVGTACRDGEQVAV